MDPTIYTMGDPMIVREALFALAAIFNSADWFNAGNGFGMGGNLLAAALIGLIGILIAGINTQSMRVDYLLTAFVLFGIAFGTKVNVNIEDIQTGNAAVVDDVPVAVAYVASLASSASYELSQTVSVALQRPGSETSTLTATTTSPTGPLSSAARLAETMTHLLRASTNASQTSETATTSSSA